MKKILSLAGIVGIAIAAGTIHSQAARHTIAMSASVGGICSIGTPTALNGFATGTTLVATATNGKADAKTATMQLPYNCNTTNVAFQLTSDKQGITKSVSPVPPGQTNKIHYTAKVNVGGSPFLATLNTTSGSTTPQAVHDVPIGNLTLEVSIPAGTTTLVPGDGYVDSLFIDVNPNP